MMDAVTGVLRHREFRVLFLGQLGYIAAGPLGVAARALQVPNSPRPSSVVEA
jgi:hypothetical protein